MVYRWLMTLGFQGSLHCLPQRASPRSPGTTWAASESGTWNILELLWDGGRMPIMNMICWCKTTRIQPRIQNRRSLAFGAWHVLFRLPPSRLEVRGSSDLAQGRRRLLLRLFGNLGSSLILPVAAWHLAVFHGQRSPETRNIQDLWWLMFLFLRQRGASTTQNQIESGRVWFLWERWCGVKTVGIQSVLIPVFRWKKRKKKNLHTSLHLLLYAWSWLIIPHSSWLSWEFMGILHDESYS